MRTILWKELREHARWLPLGLLPMLFVLVSIWRNGYVTFDFARDLASPVGLIGSCIAAALGLLQFWSDDRPAGRALLLHRGITHNAAFVGKLLAGLLLYAAVTVLPLACLSLFIAIVGKEHRPVYPDAVLPAVFVSFAAFTFWPTAVLVIRRESRLIGSRFVPCIAAVVAVMFSEEMTSAPALTFAFGIIVSVLSPILFLLAARSVFVNCNGRARGLGQAGLVITMTLSLCLGAIVSLISIITVLDPGWSNQKGTYRSYSVEFGPDGRCWLTRSRYRVSPHELECDQIARMSPAKSVREQLQPIPKGWQELTSWSAYDQPHQANATLTFPFEFIGTAPIPGGELGANRVWIFDSRQGELLVYRTGRTTQLEARLRPEGSGTESAATPQRFGNLLYPWGAGTRAYLPAFLFVTSGGVYIAPPDGSPVQTLYSIPSDSKLIGLDVPPAIVDEPFAMNVMLRLADRVVWLKSSPDIDATSGEPSRESRLAGTFYVTEALLPRELATARKIQVARAPTDSDAYLGLVRPNPRRDEFVWLQFGDDGQVQQREIFHENTTATDAYGVPTPVWWSIPPAIAMVGIAEFVRQEREVEVDNPQWTEMLVTLAGVIEKEEVTATGIVCFVLLQGILGIAVAVWAARRRRLEKRTTRRWMCIGFFLGPVGSLAVLALYPRIACESCIHCRKSTRVDLLDCEACGQPLEQTTRNGIEIFDPQT